jgi:hypothetical protein
MVANYFGRNLTRGQNTGLQFISSTLHAQIVLQGTQLLAIDTGAAMGLLKRSIIGDELTQKEKQALQRTLTDLASVVPIGILMLLPVSLS